MPGAARDAGRTAAFGLPESNRTPARNSRVDLISRQIRSVCREDTHEGGKEGSDAQNARGCAGWGAFVRRLGGAGLKEPEDFLGQRCGKHGRPWQIARVRGLLFCPVKNGRGTCHGTLDKRNVHAGKAVTARVVAAVHVRDSWGFAKRTAGPLHTAPILCALKGNMSIGTDAKDNVLSRQRGDGKA